MVFQWAKLGMLYLDEKASEVEQIAIMIGTGNGVQASLQKILHPFRESILIRNCVPTIAKLCEIRQSEKYKNI